MRVRPPIRRTPAPLIVPRDADLRLNYSFVSHVASDSTVIRSMLQSAHKHTAWLRSDRSAFGFPHTTVGTVEPPTGVWLSARVGVWEYLPTALCNITGTPEDIGFVDGTTTRNASVDFFRAPALLNLPSDAVEQVSVAVLVVRPGRQTSQLEIAGPFAWPAQAEAALRALEACIQRNVQQWLPPRPLWAGPAEDLLPDEVFAFVSGHAASRRR